MYYEFAMVRQLATIFLPVLVLSWRMKQCTLLSRFTVHRRVGVNIQTRDNSRNPDQGDILNNIPPSRQVPPSQKHYFTDHMSRICWKAVDEKLQSSTPCRAFRIRLHLTMLCATWESSLLVTYRTMQTSSRRLSREEEQWRNIAARWMCFVEGTCNTIRMYTYYLLTSGCCCVIPS